MKFYILKRRKVVEFKGSLIKHAIFMERNYQQRIRLHNVNGFQISTVFLGWSLNPKQLFETMVFNSDGHSISCIRVDDYKHALKVHKEVVKKIKDGDIV